MESEVLVEIRKLGMIYPGGWGQGAHTVFADFDLEIYRGEFLAVVGASGCGKSTLIELLAGFIRPSAGEIIVDQVSVTAPGPERIVVFQDHAVFPWYTALDNVAYGLRCRGIGREHARAEAREVLQRLGLGDFLDAYPSTLSGGMRQRVALARSLILRPKLLLLDEPFTALDTSTRSRLQDMLLSLWEEFGLTIVFVTHALSEAVYLADRVLLLGEQAGMAELEVIGLARPRSRGAQSILQLSKKLSGQLCPAAVDAEKEVSPT